MILDLGHDLDVLSGFSQNFPDRPDAVGIADEGGEDHVHVLNEIKPVYYRIFELVTAIMSILSK